MAHCHGCWVGNVSPLSRVYVRILVLMSWGQKICSSWWHLTHLYNRTKLKQWGTHTSQSHTHTKGQFIISNWFKLAVGVNRSMVLEFFFQSLIAQYAYLLIMTLVAILGHFDLIEVKMTSILSFTRFSWTDHPHTSNNNHSHNMKTMWGKAFLSNIL